MRLHRLRVQNFAAIREIEVAFGPGLNVLYGPNDLGKSTLADAIRLVLLLPHTSNHCEPYVPWAGAEVPLVELTFETEEQRIWRVRKEFGRRGSALLQESRNGQDFETVARAREVDGRLREILRWGISEPGGAGAGKGLPSSFLATALLSTQSDVTDVLRGSLQDDSSTTGKEQITAALQAAAQDPLFLALLRETQARRDEAYTAGGAKKTARGSVFKVAADRVTAAREEWSRLQKIVEESEGVEKFSRDLAEQRSRCEQAQAEAEERLQALQLLVQQSADRDVAGQRVEAARGEVLRIQKIDQEVAEATCRSGDLAGIREKAEQGLREAQVAEEAAGARLASAEESARAAGIDAEMADTVARQGLELRRAAAEQAVLKARQEIDAAARAQALVDAALRAEEEHQRQAKEAAGASERRAEANTAEQLATEALHRCSLLDRAAEARAAERQVANARADVERETALRAEWTRMSEERAEAVERRSAIFVPPAGSLTALRKIETDLAGARGALDVGLVVTVIPTAIVPLRVRKDGVAVDPGVVSQPLEVEATSEVEVDIADLATVRVRGGRLEAQEKVRDLESRWEAEVAPHLVAAGVADLEGLEGRIEEARELEVRIRQLENGLESLQSQIANLAGAAEALRDSSAQAEACRGELGDVPLETLAAELDALGTDPGATLRAFRQQMMQGVETARTAAQEAGTRLTLAEERTRSARASLKAAVEARDAALAEFPAGLPAAAASAAEALRIAQEDQAKIAQELEALQGQIVAKSAQLDAALAQAREAVEQAGRAVEGEQERLKKAIAEHAAGEGRLAELSKQREAEDLPAAENELREATARYEALPVPERMISPDEVEAAREVLARTKADLERVEREIHITQGRLQQVGGAVAREQLRAAEEAYAEAQRYDRETEAECEAWLLLLEQMKAADAAQASNLGQVLAPVIADRFQVLTEQRYQNVLLTPHLTTEGVVVAGGLKSTERISVGTREQLSTLYRLCLGEYLQTTIVLDDQLVQSDETRMEWFRGLLVEKARSFQIVVFTCRPGDYLAAEAMAVKNGAADVDSDAGFVRAIDLSQA